MLRQSLFACLGTVLLLACDGGVELDGGPTDADTRSDAAARDAALSDSGSSPRDAGAPEDAALPADAATSADGGDPCAACIAETLRWERDGGFVPYRSASEVEACRDYEHTRTPFTGGAAMSCTNTVPCEGEAITIGDLNAALAHADVVAAFAAAPILYGRDTRPVDGQLFQITLGDRTVSVGSECTGGGGPCEAIPPGVEALRALLATLEGERLAEEDCASTFP